MDVRGTKVRDDTMATDRDTLFPLQGALGYEITQALFVGKHTLLVKGRETFWRGGILVSVERREGPVCSAWTICRQVG